MITIEPITAANVQLFKDVRLRALADTPSAFGSTYAREAAFPDSEWLARALKWNGERGVGYLAMDGPTGCGIAGSFLHENDPAKAQLISMWTAPTHRQQGVGRLLVNEILNWARSRHVRELLLMVTSINEPAMAFYDRLGFARTGRTEPYPNDSALIEYEMARPVGTAF
jgi:ribosomal protein S18 acetylase RimI-like enzyme